MKWIVTMILMLAVGPVMAQAITPNSECGALATGYKADGSREIVTDTVPWAHVGADGVWTPCPVAQPKPPEPRPCPATQGWRTWSVGEYECTTRLAGTTEARGLDRALASGETGFWRQWLGPMRGQLIERCQDGVRTVSGKTCAPATECDTMISDIQREGKTYAYDARPTDKRVPLGKTVDAIAADGSHWPVTCVAGDWYVPTSLPPAPKPTIASAPKRVLYCGAQSFRSKLAPSLVLTYSGPRVLPGAEVMTTTIAGGSIAAVCGEDARFVAKWDLPR